MTIVNLGGPTSKSSKLLGGNVGMRAWPEFNRGHWSTDL